MAKSTGCFYRELGSVLNIHIVAQTIFNSSSRDMMSFSHLCKHLHMHGAYTYMSTCVVCMCVGGAHRDTKQKVSESLANM